MAEDDVYFNILLNSQIDTLRNLCLTQKNTALHCNNNYFWIKKFEHDNLPLLSDQNSISGWINEYKKVVNIQHKAANLLLVNDIERTRQYLSTNGTISISLDKEYDDYLNNILPPNLLKQLPYFSTPDSFTFIVLIPITNGYTMAYYIQPLGNEDHEVFAINSSYNEILNVIIKFLYYAPDIEILDELSNDFFPTTNDGLYYGDEETKAMLYKRDAIWDTLKYLKI